jgi:hypothetical protein
VQPEEERAKLEDHIRNTTKIDIETITKEAELINRGLNLKKRIRDVQNFTYFDKKYNLDKRIEPKLESVMEKGDKKSNKKRSDKFIRKFI